MYDEVAVIKSFQFREYFYMTNDISFLIHLQFHVYHPHLYLYHLIFLIIHSVIDFLMIILNHLMILS
jgi:hypothetical protein